MLFIFDMGGVVTTNFDMDKLYKKLSMTQDTFRNYCKFENRDIWQELETGFITTNDFWKLFNKNTEKSNIEPVTKDLFRLYFHPVINPETVEIIRNLRKKHRVVCGTNTIQSHWENHMERGDYQLFDQTYASNKINTAKPDKDFFLTILEAENAKAEETFFTDDKISNVNAALSVKINGVQFTDAKSLSEKWSKYF